MSRRRPHEEEDGYGNFITETVNPNLKLATKFVLQTEPTAKGVVFLIIRKSKTDWNRSFYGWVKKVLHP